MFVSLNNSNPRLPIVGTIPNSINLMGVLLIFQNENGTILKAENHI